MSIPVVLGGAGGELLPFSNLILKGRDGDQGYSLQLVPYHVGSFLIWFALELPPTALVMMYVAPASREDLAPLCGCS